MNEQRNFVQLDTGRINELAIEHVIEGSKLQQQNKFAESILEFQEALKYDSSASIIYAIAKSYMMLGKYESAFQNTIKSLNIEPNFIPAMELLTELYVYRNNIKDAITVYKSIYDLEPTRHRKSNLARIYEYDDIETAIQLYEDLLKQREEPEILYRIAGLYEKKADTIKMISTYEKLIRYSGKKPEAYDALIRTYLNRSNYQKAFQVLDTARINFVEDDINYFYNLTANYLLDDNNEESKKFIPKLLKDVENNFYFDWRMNMIAGYLADKIKDTALTEKFFNRALKADTIPDISLAVTLYYIRNAQYEKALSIINEFNPKFPNSFSFPFYRGLVYQNMDSNDLALNEYFLSLSLDTNNIEVLSQIGLLYDQLKKYDSCDIAYLKILSIEPDNALINNNYAYSLAVRGEKLDTAMLMSQKSLQIEPDNPSFLDTYGWIQYQLGNYELALDYILKAIRTGEENSEVLGHLGHIYLKLGRKDDAIQAWEKSLTFEPVNEEIKQQLELIR
ncbi:MAG: CDC27 family protein [bacterium]